MQVTIVFDVEEYAEIAKLEATHGDVVKVEDALMADELPDELRDGVNELEQGGYWKTLHALNEFLKGAPDHYRAYLLHLTKTMNIEQALVEVKRITLSPPTDWDRFMHNGALYRVSYKPFKEKT
jgi:hypothetical protein